MPHLIDIRTIQRELRRHKAVSFDVFDTLLVRQSGVEPTDLHYLLAVGKGLSPERARLFRKDRGRAEELCRNARQISAGHREIFLGEIYECLGAAGYPITAQDELAFERRVLTRRPFVWSIYQFAREAGLKVFAISDIYLDAATVDALLRENGVEVDRVYTSADHGCGKYDGGLFGRFLRAERLAAEDVIHIGDNLKSDHEEALKQGLKAIHVPAVVEQLFTDSQVNLGSVQQLHHSDLPFASFWLSAVARRLDRQPFESAARQFGLMYGGPLVFLFARWIEAQARERHIDTLYLLARDGYTLFEVMKKNRAGVPMQVLPCSRRSLMVPAAARDASIWERLIDDDRPIVDVLRSLGLESAEALAFLFRACGGDPRRQPLRQLSRAGRQRFLSEGRQLAMPQLARELHDTRIYLESSGLCNPRAAIVDVGWSLNSQKAMEVILGRRLRGLYLGSSRGAHVHSGIKCFLFQQGTDSGWEHVFHQAVELLELPFISTEQQVLSVRGRDVVMRERTAAECARQLAASEIREEVVGFAAEAALFHFDSVDVDRAGPLLRSVFLHLSRHPTPAERFVLGSIPHDRHIGGAHQRLLDFWRSGDDGTVQKVSLVRAFGRHVRRHGLWSAGLRAAAYLQQRARLLSRAH